tara:strand:+ start:4978 stop:5412 length:435 start_codon:yes stop_codon:yes gene_type:complete
MIFIYATLGIAMFTALGMIHETSIAILTQDIKYDKLNNDYIKSAYKGIDKDFVKLLKNADLSWGEGDILCEKVINEVKQDNSFQNLNNYIKGTNTISTSNLFTGSCVLQNTIHRIIISKIDSDYSKYSIFSCLLKKKIYCDFEF